MQTALRTRNAPAQRLDLAGQALPHWPSRGTQAAGEWHLTETLAAATVQRQAERKSRRGYTHWK